MLKTLFENISLLPSGNCLKVNIAVDGGEFDSTREFLIQPIAKIMSNVPAASRWSTRLKYK